MFFIRVNNKKSDPINTIISLIMLVVVFMLIFFVARGVFRLLTWMAPFLFIATLILDYRVILSYGKYLLRTLERNVIWGIVMTVLTVIGFPLVIAFLFGKALLFRRVKNVEKEMEEEKIGEFIPYEEVDEEDEFLDLPEFKDKEKDRDRYGRFFD
ncbi:MAG: hypothetical protein EA362_12025 [Saprospirales bacterium]|nr:MAG: hypothetical protein EA362_12025 [Saprospirales bacterium]